MQGYGYGPPQSQRQEFPIFVGDGVQVTSARLVCWQQTYPIAGITSVGPFADYPSKAFPTILGMWSLLWVVVWVISCVSDVDPWSMAMLVISVLAVGGCVAWERSIKPMFGVVITTSGMNVRAITSRNQAFTQQVIGALNQALSMR